VTNLRRSTRSIGLRGYMSSAVRGCYSYLVLWSLLRFEASAGGGCFPAVACGFGGRWVLWLGRLDGGWAAGVDIER